MNESKGGRNPGRKIKQLPPPLCAPIHWEHVSLRPSPASRAPPKPPIGIFTCTAAGRGAVTCGVMELSGGGHRETSSTTCCRWGGRRPVPARAASGPEPAKASESPGCLPFSSQVAALCGWNRGSALLTRWVPTALLSALNISSQGHLAKLPRVLRGESRGRPGPGLARKQCPFHPVGRRGGPRPAFGQGLSTSFQFMNGLPGNGAAQETPASEFYLRLVGKSATTSCSGAVAEEGLHPCPSAPRGGCEAIPCTAVGSTYTSL